MSFYRFTLIATFLTVSLSKPLPHTCSPSNDGCEPGNSGHIQSTPTADLAKMCTPSNDSSAFTLGAFMSPSYLGTDGDVSGNVDFYVFDKECNQLQGSPFKSWGTSAKGMKAIQPQGLPWGVDITKYDAPYDQNGRDWTLNAKYGAQFLYPSGGHTNGCTEPSTQTGPQNALWVTIGCPLTGR